MAKYQTVYAFIDSQNLNLGTDKDIIYRKKLVYRGWKLDFAKFRRYLKDKFHVSKAFLFIGYLSEYQNMYKQLKNFGFELVYRKTVKDEVGKPKGNVDAELVLYASAVEYPNYDQAVIVSGDGDFLCLYDYLKRRQKLLRIIIPNEKNESSLLKPYQQYKTFLQFEKTKLELKPKKSEGVAHRHSV